MVLKGTSRQVLLFTMRFSGDGVKKYHGYERPDSDAS